MGVPNDGPFHRPLLPIVQVEPPALPQGPIEHNRITHVFQMPIKGLDLYMSLNARSLANERSYLQVLSLRWCDFGLNAIYQYQKYVFAPCDALILHAMVITNTIRALVTHYWIKHNMDELSACDRVLLTSFSSTSFHCNETNTDDSWLSRNKCETMMAIGNHDRSLTTMMGHDKPWCWCIFRMTSEPSTVTY